MKLVTWPGPVPAVMLRIVRPTTQWARVRAFYQEGVGLVELDWFKDHQGYEGVMLGLPGMEHHLEIVRLDGGEPNPCPNKDNLLVFYFRDLEAIASIASRLTAMGYPPQPALNPYWNEHGAPCFYDPDGWGVVLCPYDVYDDDKPRDEKAGKEKVNREKAGDARGGSAAGNAIGGSAAGNAMDAGEATRAVHAGESSRSPSFPIFQAASVDGRYIRASNPTVEALEEKIRLLEGGGGEAMTIATASGMAAVSQTLLGLLRAGDRMIVHDRVFVGVQTLLDDFVSELGIEVARVDLTRPEELAAALSRPARLVYFETVVNPTLEVLPAPEIIAAAHAHGAWAIVDNTALTPCLFRPLEHGADAVVHSATKYLSGHGDALGGAVTCASRALGEKVHKARRILGGHLSPHSAFLIMRGLKTLPMRIDRHCRNAGEVAEFLARHPAVRQVWYPGLPATAENQVASAFLSRFGGLISFEPQEPFSWDRFTGGLRLCRPWMSFGDPGSLVQYHQRRVRLSVGIEDAGDIERDLGQALAGAGAGAPVVPGGKNAAPCSPGTAGAVGANSAN
ncbi:MAG TPA: PLP-dependent transferase [Thermoanaerobaculia bacterium]|nr:PLP-dependent transferase [Thermoanaerobaculia bacterium]